MSTQSHVSAVRWQTVIGLEVHIQLKTKSKLFSNAATTFGAPPNSQATLVDLALPGTLPVVNREAIRMAIRLGLAVSGQITPCTIFSRKSYFYPDLPKGYQISQNEHAIVQGGSVEITVDGKTKTIHLERAHLEEDAGKSVHEGLGNQSGIDLNRAGMPLIEMVSKPELHSPSEAVAYMKQVHSLVTCLDICDGNMEEGSMRCDANISVRPTNESRLGVRTEIKNLNSFRFTELALTYEIARHIALLEQGDKIIQETRLYNAKTHKTYVMRTKEEAHDYRYFPDPDLPPVRLDATLIADMKKTLPELFPQRAERFIATYALPPEEAQYLARDRDLADFFEAVVRAHGNARLAANWITGELAAYLNREQRSLTDISLKPATLAGLLRRITDKTLTAPMAKKVFAAMWKTGSEADLIIEREGLQSMTDAGAIEAIVNTVMQNNTKQVEQYRAGNSKILGFLVGQVMQESHGSADPKVVNALLTKKLQTPRSE